MNQDFQKLVDQILTTIPQGWSISLTLEQNSIRLKLVSPKKLTFNVISTVGGITFIDKDTTIQYAIDSCLNFAIENNLTRTSELDDAWVNFKQKLIETFHE